MNFEEMNGESKIPSQRKSYKVIQSTNCPLSSICVVYNFAICHEVKLKRMLVQRICYTKH